MRQVFSGTRTLLAALCATTLFASDPQLEKGLQAIQARTGCYLVDYSFVENEAVKPGYAKDNRVYDATREKSVKEWIFAESLSPTRVKLQHVLFATDLEGKMQEGSVLKHTGEDWEYNAPFLYDYAGASVWNIKSLQATPNLWTRRVTNLDDGLRYQCAAAWDLKRAYPDWTCEDYAPIPGRETRDMGRKDYQGLQRTSRIIVYGQNWLERERNVKIIEDGDKRVPLAKEVAKTWYAKLPDSECQAAQDYVKPRMAFWLLLQQAWDKRFSDGRPFIEIKHPGQPSRYERIFEIEDEYMGKDLSNPAIRAEAEAKILSAIDLFRKQN